MQKVSSRLPNKVFSAEAPKKGLGQGLQSEGLEAPELGMKLQALRAQPA